MYPIVITSSTLCHILLHTLPFHTSRYITLGLIADIIAPHYKPDPTIASVLSCVITRSIPTDNAWSLEYDQDSITKEIIGKLQSHTPVGQVFISSIYSSYRQELATYQLQLLNHLLVLLKHVDTSQNYLCRIIVLSSLQRDTFFMFHASLSVGHMNDNKKFSWIKIRLFWPKMRSYIKNWIKECDHCNITYCWRRQFSKLLFSWPVGSPFAILHVDVWYPRDLKIIRGSNIFEWNIRYHIVFVCVPVPGFNIRHHY